MKTLISRSSAVLACGALALSTTASAQTQYPEVEPNSGKLEATTVHCIHSNDTLVGTTTGDSTKPGSSLSDTVDMFRVNTCTLPLGIYQHRMFITSTTPGHTATLRGRNQVSGVIGGLDVAVQSSFPGTTPSRFNQWYGFGRGEELYYRIEGTASTTAPYSVVLASNIVTPLDAPFYVPAGSVTISTVGQGHTNNTDLWVYDAAFEPLFSFGNDDDSTGSSSLQSTLTRTMSPGTYYLAISDANLANDQASPADDANRDGNVFDFPGIIGNSSTGTGVDLTFGISNGGNVGNMPITKNDPYEVVWVRFVVIPQVGAMHPFCFGDGHAGSTPCPCGNNGTTNDHGCAGLPNAAGGFLDATGSASVTIDSVLLRAADLPPNSVCLFFQGTSIAEGGLGVQFNDGLLCASGTQVRLGTRQVDGFGNAVFGFGQPGDPLVHTAGGVPVGGGVRAYQVWYRNVIGPCGNGSNLTNGWTINWAH